MSETFDGSSNGFKNGTFSDVSDGTSKKKELLTKTQKRRYRKKRSMQRKIMLKKDQYMEKETIHKEINDDTKTDAQRAAIQEDEKKKEMIKNFTSNKNFLLEYGEYGFLKATFISALRTHSIVVELDLNNKQALINTMNIPPFAPGELCVLLKNLVAKLKKMTIAHIVQQVMKKEWLSILKPLNIFKFINENVKDDLVTVMCPVDKFPEVVMKALDFKEFKQKRI
jgi:hypothetical protein